MENVSRENLAWSIGSECWVESNYWQIVVAFIVLSHVI